MRQPRIFKVQHPRMGVSEIAGTPARRMIVALINGQLSCMAYRRALHMRVDSYPWTAPYSEHNGNMQDWGQ